MIDYIYVSADGTNWFGEHQYFIDSSMADVTEDKALAALDKFEHEMNAGEYVHMTIYADSATYSLWANGYDERYGGNVKFMCSSRWMPESGPVYDYSESTQVDLETVRRMVRIEFGADQPAKNHPLF